MRHPPRPQAPDDRVAATGRAYVGVSGWRYAPWRGHFYPPGLPQARELAYASNHFSSIEINGSFYALQRPSSFETWARQTPPGFVFTVKGPRYVTHMLRLRNAEVAVANFLASGLFALGDKLGPILWQFPANMAWDAERFEAFFDLLPMDTEQAARLARRRDQRMHGRELLDPPVSLRLRHAIEVRHASFAQPAFIEALRRRGIAWVVADTPLAWPSYEDVTSDFMYLRLHGSTELYNSVYTDAELRRWAEAIQAWRSGREPADARLIAPPTAKLAAPREVFCYFDNTDKLHAPDNALDLMQRLGGRAAAGDNRAP
ncbi:DUF72 domain-containing protein [Ramlibacter rhizophilus]|uniref:DUF72 domain-containing protein n=1 Tax=Ramlibacter rhizophilus TaxID=1781167 RepID=A0A4Z0C2Y9_9BURK|nr:DUF72 domain-containing protein [Ramlibacter rhizophilus]TFZ04858.1 DUF72 domain-containing protein [Ramlibacter rhizophilus]